MTELEQLLQSVGGQLAGFRRRALHAEALVRAFEAVVSARSAAAARADGAELPTVERLTELETENAALRARIASATDRTRLLMERVRFLRQQTERGGER